jgi:hypothetical protein
VTWWGRLLVAWAPFAVIAVLVIAVVATNAWMGRRADREHRREARGQAAHPSTQPPRPQAAEVPPPGPPLPPAAPEPVIVSTADVRRWARSTGLRVADRGPVPAQVREAWVTAQQKGEPAASSAP